MRRTVGLCVIMPAHGPQIGAQPTLEEGSHAGTQRLPAAAQNPIYRRPRLAAGRRSCRALVNQAAQHGLVADARDQFLQRSRVR